ncbi:c-type cytochrome [Pseudomonas syringae]|uniref:c-type cytochrome n=1 Tax=Pseudomonas syringae TaxID=317 RepID=UPI000CDA71D0|nr:cytochrome c [Pseudomonas syringae]POP66950.1 cytochrome C [Pseudomonas syringae]
MKALIFLSILLWEPIIWAAQLNLELEGNSQIWQTENLLNHPLSQTITIPKDVAYKRDMSYRAVPLAALLTGVAAGDHIQVIATDGFVAELSATLLLNTQGSRAWLAIENHSEPWPLLPIRDHSAGPFYLVWTDPQASDISPEQWPFQIASIKLRPHLSERFPALLPAPELTADDPVKQGFELFQKHCMACHTMNGAGDAQFGPDLNIPYNPTEYFQEKFLKRYIRDPQSLRKWPQAKMPEFSVSVISDNELDMLTAYLKHMSGRKITP